jgi:hypothetical protein
MALPSAQPYRVSAQVLSQILCQKFLENATQEKKIKGYADGNVVGTACWPFSEGELSRRLGHQDNCRRPLIEVGPAYLCADGPFVPTACLSRRHGLCADGGSCAAVHLT